MVSTDTLVIAGLQARVAELEAALGGLTFKVPIYWDSDKRCAYCRVKSIKGKITHAPDCPWAKAKKARGES